MAKLTLNSIGSRYGSIDSLNDNFDAIEQAIENTLSRDGTSPNAMEADLDMNSNDILNAGEVSTNALRINGVLVQPSTGVSTVAVFQTYEFTATAGQTLFSVAPTIPVVEGLTVSVNGLLLPPSEISVDGTNVILPACTVGDEVLIRRYTADIADTPISLTSNQITFTQAGTGAKSRTVESKLRDTFSVFDFMTTAQITDVKNGTKTLNTRDEIQAAIDAAKVTGGQVLFPKGEYRVDSPLILDYASETLDPVQGATNRVSLVGEGAGASQLVATHAGALIDYRGGTGAGAHSFFNLYNLGMTHQTARLAGSIGVLMDNCGFWRFEDVSILGFERGIDGTDTLSGSYNSGRLWSNLYGARFRRVSFSQPNAISFRSVAVAGNRFYGVLLEGGALFSMYAGSVEGNGTACNTDLGSPAARTDCWGVKITDAGGEGVVGLTIHGGYFEGNSGNADIWVSQSDDSDGLFPSGNAISTIVGTSFLRFSSTQYTDRNILFDNDVSRKLLRMSVVGCGFRSQEPYIPSALRPYIGAQVGKIHNVGNYFGSTVELDAAVFAPLSLAQIPTSLLPPVADYVDGSLMWDTTTSRMRINSGFAWKSVAEDQAFVTYTLDDTPTWVYNTTGSRTIYATTMSTTRNITLGLTGAFNGALWFVKRSSASAFPLNIYTSGTGVLLTTLTLPNDWAEFRYTGTEWELLRQGVTTSKVRASYSGTTIRLLENTATALAFPEEYDTLSEYNPATGRFTAKVAGYYHVSGLIGTNGFQMDSGETFQLRINVNGVFKAGGFRTLFYETGSPPTVASSISTTVYLDVSEYIDMIGFTNRVEDADLNKLSASATSNYFTIERVL